jgi:AcrR family transcriptional regulator
MRLFSRQGFDGTSTRQIASAAGVNEALILRYFGSKETLYWAVVSHRINKAGRIRKLREVLASDGDPRAVLAGVAETLLTRTREDADLTRLLLFSALRNSELTDDFFRTHLADMFELLADYFRRVMRQGKFRKLDPLVAARAFIGIIYHHNLVQELFGGSRYRTFDPKKVAREVSEVWLHGLAGPRATAGHASAEPEEPPQSKSSDDTVPTAVPG